jgi:hypothetical protein
MKSLNTFHADNNLDKIVDLLIDKGSTVLDLYDTDEYTNVTNDNIDFPVESGKVCDMKVIEIFSSLGMTKKTENIFLKEIELLSQINNLDRALYVFVSPHSYIPNHIDDDDKSFRIVTGVLTPSVNKDELGLVVDNNFVQLQNKQTIGLSGPEAWHHGWNNTDHYWSVLTLCMKDPQFNGIRNIW